MAQIIPGNVMIHCTWSGGGFLPGEMGQENEARAHFVVKIPATPTSGQEGERQIDMALARSQAN